MKHVIPLIILLGVSMVLVSCSSDEITNPSESNDLVDQASIDDLDKGRGRNNNPGVIPPHAKPKGKSYGEWSVAFWQWLWSVPAADNPVLYDDGALLANGQSGSVWFLPRNFGGVNVRYATVPTGKMLFIDVAGWFFAPAIGDPEDEDELRAAAAAAVEATEEVLLEVDGVEIENIEEYIVQSPDLFGFTLPEGNVLEVFGFDTPAGDYYPAVSDGYFVMLAPLSAGEHIIHIHALFPEPFGESDVTYYLTVAGGGHR